MYKAEVNSKELKDFIRQMREEYSEDFSNGMSEANHKRAVDNFEKKLEKMSTVEYQTELFGRLQKNKKQELIVGAMTKKEICKIYFNTIFDDEFIVFCFRYKVINPTTIELILEEDRCNYKKIIGGINGANKKISNKQNEDYTT